MFAMSQCDYIIEHETLDSSELEYASAVYRCFSETVFRMLFVIRILITKYMSHVCLRWCSSW